MVSEFRWPIRTYATNNILYTMYVVLHYTARHEDQVVVVVEVVVVVVVVVVEAAAAAAAAEAAQQVYCCNISYSFQLLDRSNRPVRGRSVDIVPIQCDCYFFR